MKILVLIEKTLPVKLRPVLNEYTAQLTSEGYEVETVYVEARKDPHAHVTLAKEITWPFVEKWGPNCYLQFIGNLPMPYSGISMNPDGHPDTAGAYATPVYYACPRGNWTDLRSNIGFKSKPAQTNIAGDEKLDQEQGPSDVGSELGPCLARVGWLNLSRFNAKQWGEMTMGGTDYLISCYARYFDRNFAYRRGVWKPKTMVGVTHYQNKPMPSQSAWALSIVGASQYAYFGVKSPLIEAKAPYALFIDFKLLAGYWLTRPSREPFCVLDLSYCSYQIDENTADMIHPLNFSALAVGNVALRWNLDQMFGKSTGDAWFRTISRGQKGDSLIALYGDATVPMPPAQYKP